MYNKHWNSNQNIFCSHSLSPPTKKIKSLPGKEHKFKAVRNWSHEAQKTRMETLIDKDLFFDFQSLYTSSYTNYWRMKK